MAPHLLAVVQMQGLEALLHRLMADNLGACCGGDCLVLSRKLKTYQFHRKGFGTQPLINQGLGNISKPLNVYDSEYVI
jgi:hypothetical protein